MSEEWKVEFDVMALLSEKFPGYDPADNEVWAEFGKYVGWRRYPIRQLATVSDVRHSIKVRAAVAQVVPSVLLPESWHWQDPEKERREPNFPRVDHSPVPEEIKRLKYEVLCSLMESLPPSKQFDISDHPLAPHLPRLNDQLLNYLVPPLSGEDKGEADGSWVDKQRVFACYRLQAPISQTYGFNGHFAAFNFLLHKTDFGGQRGKDEWLKWQLAADERMREFIRREIASEVDCAGAYKGYLRVADGWIDFYLRNEDSEAYDQELAVSQMEQILAFNQPGDEARHIEVLKFYCEEREIPRADLVVKGAHRYLLEPGVFSEPEGLAAHRYALSSIADTVLKVTNDEELKTEARKVITAVNELNRQEEQAAASARRKELETSRRLLERLM